MKEFTHLSEGELFFENKTQQHPSPLSKPIGMWYQINSSWEKFLHHHVPAQGRPDYTHKYKVKINPSEVLKLNTPEMLHRFIHDFTPTNAGSTPLYLYTINWMKVAEKWAGVQFDPYMPEFRLCKWYSRIDIPCGCIWNARAIKELIQEKQFIYCPF